MKHLFKKLISAAVCLTVAFSVAGCSSSKNSTASSSASASTSAEASVSSSENEGSFPYTFTDVEDREITIEKQPETFIVGNYILNFMLIGGKDSLDKVVGMPLDGWQETRYGEYEAMTKSFPEILDKTSIGGYHDDVLNSELILQLKPDVLLINKSQYTENETSIPVFEKAGIKVVVLDYHKMKLENHVKSTEILGVLLGKEATAQEMIADYTNAVDMVNTRIKDSGEEGRKTYVELGNKGIGEYGNSYTGCLWGSIIDNVGGINIADSVLDPEEGYGALDKEYVLSQNPDVILIGGSIWTGTNTDGDQMRMGLTVDSQMSQERLQGFMTRDGWSSLNAVKNGEVYGVDHGSLRFMGDYVYTLAVAKAVYPDVFEDIDPQKEMENFYAKYLPEFDSTGTYFIKLEK